MLCGEHAVLYGQHALVCALSQRIAVTLIPRNDKQIIIDAETLGCGQFTLEREIVPQSPFQFVLACIQHVQPQLTKGFTLQIRSAFSHRVGLASSAAVTVATVQVLAHMLGQDCGQRAVFFKALDIVLQVQGVASGADVAASVYGGIIHYRYPVGSLEKLTMAFPLVTIYSGSKTLTVDVIKQLSGRYQQQPDFYRQLFSEIGVCTIAARDAIKMRNWQQLGEQFSRHYVLQLALALNTPEIDRIIAFLGQQHDITGAKISGAGLGDCVIGVGYCDVQALTAQDDKMISIETCISTEGVRIDDSR